MWILPTAVRLPRRLEGVARVWLCLMACVYHLALWFVGAWAPRCLSMLTAVQQYSSAAGACVPCVQVVLAAERTNLPKVSAEGMLHTLT
jgi:hypothetical protein